MGSNRYRVPRPYRSIHHPYDDPEFMGVFLAVPEDETLKAGWDHYDEEIDTAVREAAEKALEQLTQETE
jgi:hypothetical protein